MLFVTPDQMLARGPPATAANRVWPRSLLFVAERAAIRPRVQRLAALPAEPRGGGLAGAQAVLDALRVVAAAPPARPRGPRNPAPPGRAGRAAGRPPVGHEIGRPLG